jgi:hypothetical protein
MTYTVKLSDGKYTIINHPNQMEFRRHGDPWPGADDLKFCGVLRAAVDRIEELETTIQAVLDGSLTPVGRAQDGIRSYGTQSNAIPLRQWESSLRAVLEQS